MTVDFYAPENNWRKQVRTALAASSSGVPDTRQALAGVGLSGGGALSSDVTLLVADVIAAAGPIGDSSHVAQITFNSRGQLTTVSSVAITAAAVGGVPTSRLISTTAPISGGGDLSADRTLSLSNNGITNALFRQSAGVSVVGNSTGSTANVADIAAGSDGLVLRRASGTLAFSAVPFSGLSSKPTTLSGYGITDAVPSSRTVTAGTGLTGGGDLSANRTFSIANTITAGGPIGTSSIVPVITWNAQGQLTAVTTASIATTPPFGLADGGSKTGAFTAAVNTRYNVTFASADTITGPASASVQDVLLFVLANEGVSHTFNPNGLKVNASTANLVLPPNQSLIMTYTGTTYGWI